MTDADTLLQFVDQRLVYPPFLQIVRLVHEDASREGADMYSGCIYRPPDAQQTEYLKGRKTKGPNVTPAKPLGDTVTRARPWHSMHQYAIADDGWRDADLKKKGLQVSWKPEDYAVWVRCAQKRGLKALGPTMGDWPHVELDIASRGVSLAMLRAEALSVSDPREGVKRAWALLDRYGPWTR